MKIKLLILIVFLTNINFAQSTYKIYKHVYRFGEVVKKGSLISSVHYDKNDILIQKTNYTGNARIKNYIKYKYDDSKNLILEEMFSRRNIVIKKTIYKYDTLNRLLQEINYNSRGKFKNKIEYLYNPGYKHWHTRRKLNRHSQYSKTVVKEFDENGYRKSGIIYKADNSPKYKFKIEGHDKFGNELEKVFYKPNGKHFLRISSKWDENNNLIDKIYEGKYKHKYFYNSENKLIKEIHYNPQTYEAIELLRYVKKQ